MKNPDAHFTWPYRFRATSQHIFRIPSKQLVLANLYGGPVRADVTLTKPNTSILSIVDFDVAGKIDYAADDAGRTMSRFVAINLEAYIEQNPNDVQALYSEDSLSSPEMFARTNL